MWLTWMWLTNVPTRSQSIRSKLGKICQKLTVENVHVVNHGVRDTVRLTWTWKHSEARGDRGHAPPGNFEIWAPWKAENVLEILQSLCFLYLKAWHSPDFQRFKSLDPPPLLQNFIDDPPLWSPAHAPPPPPPNKYRTFPNGKHYFSFFTVSGHAPTLHWVRFRVSVWVALGQGLSPRVG